MKIATPKTVALWMTESELNAGVSCAQDMMHALRLLESLELQVKLIMITWTWKIIGVLVTGHVILKHTRSTFASGLFGRDVDWWLSKQD